MFCPNCGQPVSDSAKFCEYCGFPMSSVQYAANTAANEQPTQAQPDVTYQQPVQAQPVAYQQMPTAQQVPSYAQTSIPTTTKKSFTQTGLFKVICIVVAIAAAFGIGHLVRKGLNSLFDRIIDNGTTIETGTDIDIPGIDIPNIDVDNIIDNLNFSNPLMIDSNGNPKVYSLLNCSGSSIVEALEGAGWSYDEDFVGWLSEDGNNAFFVNGLGDYEYDEDDIAAMDVDGGNDPCIMGLWLDDERYSSIEDLRDIVIGSINDQYEEDGDMFYVVTSVGLEQNLIYLWHDTDNGLYRMYVCNPASISEGLLYEAFGIEGSTIDEAWEYLTGRSIAKG